MMSRMRLQLELEGMGGNTTGFVIDPAVVDELGGGKRPKVVVTTRHGSTEHTWRSSIASMGGRYLLGVSKANREAAGIAAGDVVDLEVTLDDAPREVEVPADLAQALADAGLREAWDALSYSHQRQHVMAVEDAKKPETRARRIAAAIVKLGNHNKKE